jgi:hypothetical protein
LGFDSGSFRVVPFSRLCFNALPDPVRSPLLCRDSCRFCHLCLDLATRSLGGGRSVTNIIAYSLFIPDIQTANVLASTLAGQMWSGPAWVWNPRLPARRVRALKGTRCSSQTICLQWFRSQSGSCDQTSYPLFQCTLPPGTPPSRRSAPDDQTWTDLGVPRLDRASPVWLLASPGRHRHVRWLRRFSDPAGGPGCCLRCPE